MKPHGLSLVEVMIAISILAIATTAVLLSLLGNVRLTESNRETIVAAQAARRVLNDMTGSGPVNEILKRFNATTTDDVADGNNPGNWFDVWDHWFYFCSQASCLDAEGNFKNTSFTRENCPDCGNPMRKGYTCVVHPWVASEASGPCTVLGCTEQLKAARLLLDVADGNPNSHCGSITFPMFNGQLREDHVTDTISLPNMDFSESGGVDQADHATDYRFLPVLIQVRWRGMDGQFHTHQLRAIIR